MTKAEIERLLKQVSGQLEQLQADLATSTNQPRPEAGTGTSSQLYEEPMKLDAANGQTLPIQLQTDTAPTQAARRGSGVGQPSGTAARGAPAMTEEAAQPAATPREETPVSRQMVPPEYRGVFDRLHTEQEPTHQ